MGQLVEDPEETPSARVIAELSAANTGFFRFALQMAQSHRDYFAAITQPNKAAVAMFKQEATESLQRQRDIEAADSITLDEYLAEYFEQT